MFAMDMNLVFSKTPTGDEAVQQRTRVVQRNLRMVLVQVDGKLTVADLAGKIGNASLVVSALKELETAGFVYRKEAAPGQPDKPVRRNDAVAPAFQPPLSRFSQFPDASSTGPHLDAQSSMFSIFEKPAAAEKPEKKKSALPPLADLPTESAESAEAKPRRAGQKLVTFTLVILLLLVGSVFLFPYNYFRPAIEASLSSTFNTPVRVGDVRLSILPTPTLILSDIKIAATSVGKARLGSPLALLMSGMPGVERVELSAGLMDAEQLLRLPGLLGGAAGRLQQVSIDHFELRMAGHAIRDLGGVLHLTPAGQLEKLHLETVDRSLRLDAQLISQGLAIAIDAYGWKPDADSLVVFDSLQGKALLQPGKLLLQDIDASLLGGVLKGKLLLDWQQSVALSGDASLARLNAQRLATVFLPQLKLEGEVGGVAHWQAQGSDLKSALAASEVSLDLEMQRGAFNGVDIGEATRRGQGQVVRSGSTRFDQLRAEVSFNPHRISARRIQLTAGMMSAQGELSGQSGGQVDGGFTVTMQTSVASQRTPVRVSGRLPNLEAVSTSGR